MQPKQKQKYEKHGKRFVELCRVQESVGGHSGNRMTELAKLNAPRKVRRFTPATTRSKATLPPEEISNRNPWRARVSCFPPGQFVTLHQKIAAQHCPDEAAIKHAAGAEEV